VKHSALVKGESDQSQLWSRWPDFSNPANSFYAGSWADGPLLGACNHQAVRQIILNQLLDFSFNRRKQAIVAFPTVTESSNTSPNLPSQVGTYRVEKFHLQKRLGWVILSTPILPVWVSFFDAHCQWRNAKSRMQQCRCRSRIRICDPYLPGEALSFQALLCHDS
jgi:hypothetical protein